MSFKILVVCLSLAATASCTIVLNEVNADNPGQDDMEFIELFNTDETEMSLDNYKVALINGFTKKVYGMYDLKGYKIPAGGYFVIGSSKVTLTVFLFQFIYLLYL